MIKVVSLDEKDLEKIKMVERTYPAFTELHKTELDCTNALMNLMTECEKDNCHSLYNALMLVNDCNPSQTRNLIIEALESIKAFKQARNNVLMQVKE